MRFLEVNDSHGEAKMNPILNRSSGLTGPTWPTTSQTRKTSMIAASWFRHDLNQNRILQDLHRELVNTHPCASDGPPDTMLAGGHRDEALAFPLLGGDKERQRMWARPFQWDNGVDFANFPPLNLVGESQRREPAIS
jgi:hypothetical protein